MQDLQDIPLSIKYAMVAAEQALSDAQWKPTTLEDRELTVRILFFLVCMTSPCSGSRSFPFSFSFSFVFVVHSIRVSQWAVGLAA